MSWILHYVEHLFSEWDIRGYLKTRGQERESAYRIPVC